MGVTIGVNGRSVVHKDSGGIKMTAPDVCKTPTPGGPVPIPYPNIAKSGDTDKGTKKVSCDGNPTCIATSEFSTSTGDEAGTVKGIASSKTKGAASFVTKSADVMMEGKGVARALDLMLANDKNTPPAPVAQGPVVAIGSNEKPVCVICGEEFDEGDADKHLKEFVKANAHHKVSKNTEGGTCLERHVDSYTQNSCSHAYQAHVISKKERTDVYNLTQARLDAISTKTVRTGAYATDESIAAKKKDPSKKVKYNHGHKYAQKTPQEVGDWDLDGPKRSNVKGSKGKETKAARTTKKGKEIAGRNFKKTEAPYWHNTHHLISSGIFNKLLGEDSEVEAVMRAALYFGKYNFNYGINTIILPQGLSVAKILKLPRHLNMKNPVPGQAKHCTQHPEYDKKVKRKLQEIIETYKDAVKEAQTKVCEKCPDVELDIDKLDDLSEECYDSIIEFGQKNAGKSLDQIEQIGE